ncbi:unnamed protein product [Clonostachys solani]|uniref:Uncharacterized protein n=1 Tax=Clonostachys solani TaxID=160281 RepID=A0A9P0EFU7_9HYPO|nr:unnamed protein product [Clonostachys solani]
MVAVKQLGLAALLWLGLANQGLALGIDETTNDLMLVQRSSGNLFSIVPMLPKRRAEEIQLDERDFEELDERDLDLEERGFRKGFNPGVAKWKKPRDVEERGFRKGFNPGVAKWKKPRDVEERGFRNGFNPGVAKWKKPRDLDERGFRKGFNPGVAKWKKSRDVEESS